MMTKQQIQMLDEICDMLKSRATTYFRAYNHKVKGFECVGMYMSEDLSELRIEHEINLPDIEYRPVRSEHKKLPKYDMSTSEMINIKYNPKTRKIISKVKGLAFSEDMGPYIVKEYPSSKVNWDKEFEELVEIAGGKWDEKEKLLEYRNKITNKQVWRIFNELRNQHTDFKSIDFDRKKWRGKISFHFLDSDDHPILLIEKNRKLGDLFYHIEKGKKAKQLPDKLDFPLIEITMIEYNLKSNKFEQATIYVEAQCLPGSDTPILNKRKLRRAEIEAFLDEANIWLSKGRIYRI